MDMSLVLHLHATCIFAGHLQTSNTCHRFKTVARPAHLAHFCEGAEPTAPATKKWRFSVQSGPRMACFARFDLEIKRASRRNGVHFFNNTTSQSARGWSALTFWLRARAACTFSTAQLPKVLPRWGVFAFWPRHSRVQFLIAHPAKWLRTRRFSGPAFRPSGTAKHRKTVFRSTFSRAFTDLLSLLSLSSHKCCCICPRICRKFDF